jgi:hypothetical protein
MARRLLRGGGGAPRGEAPVTSPKQVVWWIITLASVAALLISIAFGYQSRSYAQCQSAVYEALISAQNAREAAAAQDRQADRDEAAATAVLIRAVFTAASREQTLAAYAAYEDTLAGIAARREASEADRAANPLPAPPSQTCR